MGTIFVIFVYNKSSICLSILTHVHTYAEKRPTNPWKPVRMFIAIALVFLVMQGPIYVSTMVSTVRPVRPLRSV